MKLPKLLHKILKIYSVSNLHKTYYKSPIGTIEITGTNDEIHAVSILDDDISSFEKIGNSKELEKCKNQLEEYFKGTRISFDLKLKPQGTVFQQKVWDELLNIKFNKTRTYLEQTKAIGNVKAIRAVASANGKNPIAIIIPCHRVIGTDGSLTGYAGGLWRKKWLLEHENPVKQQSLF